MKRIRIDRPRIRRGQPCPEDLPPDARDPDVVRSVMGLGGAMTFPATLSLIFNTFTQRAERARAIGL